MLSPNNKLIDSPLCCLLMASARVPLTSITSNLSPNNSWFLTWGTVLVTAILLSGNVGITSIAELDSKPW